MNTDNKHVTLSYEDRIYFGASIRHLEDGEEYYLAREVSTFLGYTKWTAFLTVLHRARKVCEQFGDASLDFKPIEKLTPTGKGLARSVDDYRLSRHAFLLIVMNADVYLSVVAQGKGWIAESVIKAQEAEVQRQKVEELQEVEVEEKTVYLGEVETETVSIFEAFGIDEQAFQAWHKEKHGKEWGE